MTESGEGHKFSDGKVIVSDDKGVGGQMMAVAVLADI